MRLQQFCRESGRQGQRIDRRDHGRDRDRDRELFIESTGDAGEEGHRHEYRAEHQRDRDDRPGHFLHRLVRGRERRTSLADIALNVLDHDDRVVDHNSNGKHQAEQGECIDREAEQIEHGKRADDRHRHRDQRNDRSAPGLQEQDHNQHDERDRLEQRMHDCLDRLAHEDRGIVVRTPGQTRWKALRQLFHLRDHGIARCQRVCARRLKHAEDRSRGVVELAAYRIVAGAEIDVRHVGQAHDLAVRAGLEHDAAELLGRTQPALCVDRDQEVGAALDRLGAELAGRDLQVLLPDRAHDVAGGETARGDLVGVEPNAHRVIAAAKLPNLSDTGQARDLVLDPYVGVVAQIERVVSAVRDQRNQHEKSRTLLLGRHAEADHLRRQARQGLGNTVLHIDLRLARISAGAERDRHLQRAVGTGDRLHVHHVFDAVDLFFQRSRHGFGDDFGIGAWISRLDDDRRRHHFRVFANGQQRH